MKHPPLSREQVTRVIEAASGELNALLETLYASGGRVSEVCGLTWGNVDWGQLAIRLQGKGGDQRLVPIYARTGRAVIALRRLFEASEALRCVSEGLDAPPLVSLTAPSAGGHFARFADPPSWAHLKPTDRVFSLTDQQVRDRLRALGRRLGLEHQWTEVKKDKDGHERVIEHRDSISPHDFRRAFTTHLLNNGANLRAVQDMLGHSRCDTTRIYWQQSDPRLKALSDSVESSLPRARAFLLSHPASHDDLQRPQLDP